MIQELSHLNSQHDVFLVMIDSAFAFELPDVSAGWVNVRHRDGTVAPGVPARAAWDGRARDKLAGRPGASGA